MYSFNQILTKSKYRDSKKMADDLYYSESSAQPFFKLIKKYFEENPEASNSDAFDFFFDLFNNSNMELSFLPTIKSNTLRLNICKHLVSNPKELETAYDKIHREEERGKNIEINEMEQYSSNKLRSERLAVLQALDAIRKYKQSCSKEEIEAIKAYIKAPSKIKSQYRRNMNSQSRKAIDEFREYFEGSECEQLKKFLARRIPEFEEDLRDSYIISLEYLGKQFKKFGLLDKYCKDQERFLTRLGMKELKYPLNDEQNDNGSITVENLFTEETLDKLDTNRLGVLTAFWVNRYTKELEKMNQAFFLVSSLNLWHTIKDAKQDERTGKISIDIDEKELEAIYEKMYFLREISQCMIEDIEHESKAKENIVVAQNGNTVRKMDVSDYIDELDRTLGGEYSEYFNTKNPDFTNNFIRDFDTYRIMDNTIFNAYKLKDMNIIAILSNLQNLNFSKNWGIILEDGKDIRTSKKVLLGIDIQGLNMPMRLHIDKSVLEDFFKANQNTSLVPVYEGEEDFRYQGRVISTQVLMPLSGAQKTGLKQIEERQKIDSPLRNLVEHLKFLANSSEYPEHLKEERVSRKKGKTKIVKKVPDTRFVDLKTGKLYNKNKDGELLEIKEKTEEKEVKHE